ncbi:hypothetical protein V8Z80_16930 [Orrella sp. JC864]|uniref:hypothetical protein n=1 Tax=Orrella sp. JC864 TaxID=3120298 RepID=UPI0030090F57
MNIHVFGRSHTYCLRKALAKQGPPLASDHFVIADTAELRKRKQEGVSDGQMLKDHFDKGSPPSRQFWFSWVGGNEHNLIGLMRHPRHFDFIHPQDPGLPLDPGAEILTYGLVKAALRESAGVKRSIETLTQARKAINAPLYQIEPPPPKADDDFIRLHLGQVFREQYGASAQVPDIAPASLRRKTWLAYCDVMREECAKLTVGYVATPPSVMDRDGYLLPQAYANDATHGNAWYGGEMLKVLSAIANGRQYPDIKDAA